MVVSDVTVIGLGEMGSALARALMRADRRVTVWNRSAAKAGPLTAEGAQFAETAAAAAAASPMTMMCVSDYQAARDILETRGTAAALKGRTLVQLGNGTPKEARDSFGRAPVTSTISMERFWPGQARSAARKLRSWSLGRRRHSAVSNRISRRSPAASTIRVKRLAKRQQSRPPFFPI